MRRILSSIDIGTNSIKLIVAEIFRDRVNILCAVSEESRGIKKGLIENFEDAVYSVKKTLKTTISNLFSLPKKTKSCIIRHVTLEDTDMRKRTDAFLLFRFTLPQYSDKCANR